MLICMGNRQSYDIFLQDPVVISMPSSITKTYLIIVEILARFFWCIFVPYSRNLGGLRWSR
jgi:hypothetical protein